MSEIIGKIEWIAPKPNEYQGQSQLSIKVKGQFYNFHDTEDKLKKLATRIKKGFEVKLKTSLNIIDDIEVLDSTVEKEIAKKGSFQDQLERVNYKTLTDQAHKIGLISMKVEFVPELSDVSKKTACFKATATIRKNVGVNGAIGMVNYTYEDFGDACGLEESEGGNIDQKTIRNAWIRMASTRAQVRALKQATNNMEVAEEELPNAVLESEEKVKKVSTDKEMTNEEMQDALEDQYAEEQTKP